MIRYNLNPTLKLSPPNYIYIGKDIYSLKYILQPFVRRFDRYRSSFMEFVHYIDIVYNIVILEDIYNFKRFHSFWPFQFV